MKLLINAQSKQANANSVHDLKQVSSRKQILKCLVKYINSIDLKQLPSWKQILKCSVKYILKLIVRSGKPWNSLVKAQFHKKNK